MALISEINSFIDTWAEDLRWTGNQDWRTDIVTGVRTVEEILTLLQALEAEVPTVGRPTWTEVSDLLNELRPVEGE